MTKANRPANVVAIALLFAACNGRIAGEREPASEAGPPQGANPPASVSDAGSESDGPSSDQGPSEASTVIDAAPVIDASPPVCPAPNVTCDAACVDIESDPQNCGACGFHCSGNCGQGMCTPGGGW